MHKIHWEFEMKTDKLLAYRRSYLLLINKKKTYHQEYFEVLADHWGKMKDSEKFNIFLDLTRELKTLWSINVTGIPIVVSALGTGPKCLDKRLKELEIRGRIGIIQTTALRLALILRRVLETRGDLLSLRLQWKATNQNWCEKPVIIIIIEDNRHEIDCYFESNPTQRSYRKRMIERCEKYAKFNTKSQRPTEKVRISLKKGWFSDF